MHVFDSRGNNFVYAFHLPGTLLNSEEVVVITSNQPLMLVTEKILSDIGVKGGVKLVFSVQGSGIKASQEKDVKWAPISLPIKKQKLGRVFCLPTLSVS